MMPEDQNQQQSFGQATTTMPDASTTPTPSNTALEPTTVSTTSAPQVAAPDTATPAQPEISVQPEPIVAPAPVAQAPAASPAQPTATSAGISTGQPFGVGTPAGHSNTQVQSAIASAPKPMSNKKLLMVALGVVGAIAIVFGIYALLTFGKQIKAADVTSAKHAIQTINDDISDISSATDKLNNSPTADEITSSVNTISTKVADAQKQYNTLKHSVVLNDSDTKAKFALVDKKWPAYTQYVKDNTTDMQAFEPIVAEFDDKIKGLTSTPVTASNFATYLAQYKKILDSCSSQISNIHMKVSENQQTLSTLKSFLDMASSSVADAQKVIATNPNNISDAQDKLFKIADSASSFSSSMSKIESAITQKENSLDPSSQFNALDSQLNILANKVQN